MADIADYTLDEIGERLIVMDEANNDVAFRVNLGTMVYFRNYHLATTREALGRCVQQYCDLFGSTLQWCSNPATGKVINYPGRTPPAVYLASTDCVHGYEQIIYGGDSKRGAPTHRIQFAAPHERYATGDKFAGDLGQLYFTVPLAWWRANQAQFADLLLAFCSNLPVQYSHSGLNGEVSALEKQHEHLAFYLAQNYWGLHFYRLNGSAYVDGHIGSVNWLNILSTTTIDRLGGMAQLTDTLAAAGIASQRWGELLCISADKEPQTGFQSAPVGYQKLAAILQQARVEEYYLPYAFNVEKATRWLKRFDLVRPEAVPLWPGTIEARNNVRMQLSPGNSWLEVVTS